MSPETALLAEIHETTLSLLQMSSLPLPAHLHVEGLRGGLHDIRDKTQAAFDAAVEEGDDE